MISVSRADQAVPMAATMQPGSPSLPSAPQFACQPCPGIPARVEFVSRSCQAAQREHWQGQFNQGLAGARPLHIQPT